MFHNSNVFGSCNIHILYTGCAKIKKKIIPAPKGTEDVDIKWKITLNVNSLGKEKWNRIAHGKGLEAIHPVMYIMKIREQFGSVEHNYIYTPNNRLRNTNCSVYISIYTYSHEHNNITVSSDI